MDDVGVFRTTIEIQNLDLRGPRQALPETLDFTASGSAVKSNVYGNAWVGLWDLGAAGRVSRSICAQ